MIGINRLQQLLAERQKSPFRLGFSDELESLYRNDLRKLLRITRVALFFAIGVGFGIMPFQEVSLFHAPPAMRGSLLLFAQTITPLALLAAALTWLRAPLTLTQGVQMAAIFGALISVLVMRRFSLIGSFEFSTALLGSLAIAVAVFGGFTWKPIVVALVAFFGMGIYQEFALSKHGVNAPLEAYQLTIAFVIALLASFTNEVLRRQNWLQKECATALSRTDLLTGLPNHVHFDRRFAVTLDAGRNEHKQVAVLLLDVDHFKGISDRHGHAARDSALCAVADVLEQAAARHPEDICARIGEKEFIVVWYDVSPETLPAMVSKLMGDLRAIRVEMLWVEEKPQLAASAAVCWTLPEASTQPKQVIQFCDALMYKAKSESKDRIAQAPFVRLADS